MCELLHTSLVSANRRQWSQLPPFPGSRIAARRISRSLMPGDFAAQSPAISRPSGEWNDYDYDVAADGVVVRPHLQGPRRLDRPGCDRRTATRRRARPLWRHSRRAGGGNKKESAANPPRKRLAETRARCITRGRPVYGGLSGRELPDVLPCKRKYDRCYNRQQAQLSPQIVGQAAASVVALHSHGRPPLKEAPSSTVAIHLYQKWAIQARRLQIRQGADRVSARPVWACPWFDLHPNFALRQTQSRRSGSSSSMATRVFFCPHTGQRVQGWFADDGSENGGDTYQGVTCLACNQLHMVNPRTGKVLGADEETN